MKELKTYTQIIEKKNYLKWLKHIVLNRQIEISYIEIFFCQDNLGRDIINRCIRLRERRG